jgi:hypothetical protein
VLGRLGWSEWDCMFALAWQVDYRLKGYFYL